MTQLFLGVPWQRCFSDRRMPLLLELRQMFSDLLFTELIAAVRTGQYLSPGACKRGFGSAVGYCKTQQPGIDIERFGGPERIFVLLVGIASLRSPENAGRNLHFIEDWSAVSRCPETGLPTPCLR